jgi:hypothetical protein
MVGGPSKGMAVAVILVLIIDVHRMYLHKAMEALTDNVVSASLTIAHEAVEAVSQRFGQNRSPIPRWPW